MVAAVGRSERTPVFLIGGSWDRFSWYLRLPGPPSHPWSGIARLECAANVTAAEVIALANLSQAVLPRFASEEFKDRGRRRTSTRWELWRRSFVAGSVTRVWRIGRCDRRRTHRSSPFGVVRGQPRASTAAARPRHPGLVARQRDLQRRHHADRVDDAAVVHTPEPSWSR